MHVQKILSKTDQKKKYQQQRHTKNQAQLVLIGLKYLLKCKIKIGVNPINILFVIAKYFKSIEEFPLKKNE